MRTILAVLLTLACGVASGVEPETLAEKRQALVERIAAGAKSAAGMQAAVERVAKLTDNQVEALLDYYLSGKADRDQQAAEDLDRKHDQAEALRAAAIRAYQQRLAAARGGRPGYAPVITTLPSGASLGASAVVSPDRRYVRISAQPFFSQVNGFSTFNMATGETRYYSLVPGQGGGIVPYSPMPVPMVQPIAPQPALGGRAPRPALEGYVPRPALQPR
jgi:hypothetical protein